MMKAKHPWLEDGRGDDVDPANAAAVTLGDGSIHYVSPGSLTHLVAGPTELHVPMTKARTEATLARSSERNWAAMGAANEPSTRVSRSEAANPHILPTHKYKNQPGK
jgi:hypothetical protein